MQTVGCIPYFHVQGVHYALLGLLDGIIEELGFAAAISIGWIVA